MQKHITNTYNKHITQNTTIIKTHTHMQQTHQNIKSLIQKHIKHIQQIHKQK